jgi:hypothetical protein
VYLPDDNDDGDTDDDYSAGPEKTRAFLYRHFTIGSRSPEWMDLWAHALDDKGENPRELSP